MEFLEYDFMRRALFGLVLLAPACAMIGVQVVNFRMSYFSDAISHSSIAALGVGLLLGLRPLAVILPFGVAVAWAVLFVRRKTALSSDTVIGVLSATLVALGLAMTSHAEAGRNLEALLFGRDILVLRDIDLAGVFVLFAAVAVFEWRFFNELLLIGIDASLARSRGVPVQAVEWLFATLLAVVVLVSIQFVGLLLVTAMLIVPAASARNLAGSAAGMFWWSVVVSLLASGAGLALSFYADARTGACIVLLSAAAFFGSMMIRTLRQQRGAYA
jgi:zinc transport system permease protein